MGNNESNSEESSDDCYLGQGGAIINNDNVMSNQICAKTTSINWSHDENITNKQKEYKHNDEYRRKILLDSKKIDINK